MPTPAQRPRPPGLIRIRAAQRLLADAGYTVHVNTVRRWWDKGRGITPYVSPSGHRLYDPAELAALVRRHRDT